MIPTLVSFLEQCSSPDNQLRRAAEVEIKNAVNLEGFWASLLTIATDDSFNEGKRIDVCLSAAVQFKNIVSDNWKYIQSIHADDSVSQIYAYA